MTQEWSVIFSKAARLLENTYRERCASHNFDCVLTNRVQCSSIHHCLDKLSGVCSEKLLYITATPQGLALSTIMISGMWGNAHLGEIARLFILVRMSIQTLKETLKAISEALSLI